MAKKSKKKHKKNPASVRRVKGKRPKLSQAKPSEYEIIWNAKRTECFFGHKDGVGGQVGSGLSDVVMIFTGDDDEGYIYVLSINYEIGYACIEIFDDSNKDEPLYVCYAEPEDIQSIFGESIAEVSPKRVATELAKECME